MFVAFQFGGTARHERQVCTRGQRNARGVPRFAVMKNLCLLLLLFCCACIVKYQVITAARKLPIGTVIRDADLTTHEVSMYYPINRLPAILTEDRARVVGHTVKSEIWQGQMISLKQIEP